jgi:hypothetical protein
MLIPMSDYSRRLLNKVLLVICALSMGHLAWWWNKFRPRIMFGHAAVECADTVAGDAYDLAQICRAIIHKIGPLPTDPAKRGRVISENAETLGFTWPNDFKINANGEICDCAGQPFQILVARDRVAISSTSLYAFYFAALNVKATDSNKQ